MNALSIRRFEPSDLEAVRSLHHVALTRVGLRPGDGVYYDHDLPRIREVYLEDQGDFLVGEVAGHLMAMGGIRRVDSQTAEVCRLRVHPDFQGRGYGSAMLAALESRASELGYVILRGDTTLNQATALELYRKYGWRETSRTVINGIITVYGEKRLAMIPPTITPARTSSP